MNPTEFLNTKENEINKNIEVLRCERDLKLFEFIRLSFNTSVLTFAISSISLLTLRREFFHNANQMLLVYASRIAIGSGVTIVPLYILNDQRYIRYHGCDDAIRKYKKEISDYRFAASLYGEDSVKFHQRILKFTPMPKFSEVLRDIDRANMLFHFDKRHYQ